MTKKRISMADRNKEQDPIEFLIPSDKETPKKRRPPAAPSRGELIQTTLMSIKTN